MASDAVFGQRMTALRRRARLLVAERAALGAGACAAGLCLALVALDKFRILRVEWVHLAALVALGLAAGWLWGFFSRLRDFDVARAAEERMALKERLSSAVVLQPLAANDAMIEALVDDAAQHLDPVRPSRLFPRRLGRRGQAFLALLVLAAAAAILPELPTFQSRATRRERAALRKQGETLVRLARRLEKRPDPHHAKITRQIALNMKALGKDMKTARLTRKQAFVRLNRLEKQVAQAKREMYGSPGKKSLAEAASEIKTAGERLAQMRAVEHAKLMAKLKAGREAKSWPRAGEGKHLTQAQMKALEKLASSLKTSQSQQLLNMPEDLASKLAELLAKNDVQEALKILQRLAHKLQSQKTLRKLTPQQRKQLAEELRRLAEFLKNTDLDALARRMLELAKALERGDLKLCQNCAARMGGT